MVVEIIYRPIVTGGNLGTGQLVVSEVRKFEGTDFFEFGKSRDIERMCLGRVTAQKRLLQHASIFTTMIAQRNAAAQDAPLPKADDDLMLEDEQPQKKKKKTLNKEEKIVHIDVCNGEQTCNMKVLFLGNTKSACFVELTTSNIQFLMDTVKQQVEQDRENKRNQKSADSSGHKNIFWFEKKNAYRVLYTVEGKVHQKLVSVTDICDKDAALQKAIAFQKEHCENLAE